MGGRVWRTSCRGVLGAPCQQQETGCLAHPREGVRVLPGGGRTLQVHQGELVQLGFHRCRASGRG